MAFTGRVFRTSATGVPRDQTYYWDGWLKPASGQTLSCTKPSETDVTIFRPGQRVRLIKVYELSRLNQVAVIEAVCGTDILVRFPGFEKADWMSDFRFVLVENGLDVMLRLAANQD